MSIPPVATYDLDPQARITRDPAALKLALEVRAAHEELVRARDELQAANERRDHALQARYAAEQSHSKSAATRARHLAEAISEEYADRIVAYFQKVLPGIIKEIAPQLKSAPAITVDKKWTDQRDSPFQTYSHKVLTFEAGDAGSKSARKTFSIGFENHRGSHGSDSLYAWLFDDAVKIDGKDTHYHRFSPITVPSDRLHRYVITIKTQNSVTPSDVNSARAWELIDARYAERLKELDIQGEPKIFASATDQLRRNLDVQFGSHRLTPQSTFAGTLTDAVRRASTGVRNLVRRRGATAG